MLSEDILTPFTCFTNEIRGGSTNTAYMQNGIGWADRRLSIVGGGGGDRALSPPPLEIGTKGCQRKF